MHSGAAGLTEKRENPDSEVRVYGVGRYKWVTPANHAGVDLHPQDSHVWPRSPVACFFKHRFTSKGTVQQRLQDLQESLESWTVSTCLYRASQNTSVNFV